MDQIAEAAANDSLMPMAGCASQNPGGTPRRRSSGTTAAPRSLTRPPVSQQGEHVEDADGAIAIEVAAGGSSRANAPNRIVRSAELTWPSPSRSHGHAGAPASNRYAEPERSPWSSSPGAPAMAVEPGEGHMGNVGPSEGNQVFRQFWEFLQERPLAGTSLIRFGPIR